MSDLLKEAHDHTEEVVPWVKKCEVVGGGFVNDVVWHRLVVPVAFWEKLVRPAPTLADGYLSLKSGIWAALAAAGVPEAARFKLAAIIIGAVLDKLLRASREQLDKRMKIVVPFSTDHVSSLAVLDKIHKDQVNHWVGENAEVKV